MANFKSCWKSECVNCYLPFAEAAVVTALNHPIPYPTTRTVLVMLAERAVLPVCVAPLLARRTGAVLQLLAVDSATRYQSIAMLDTLTGESSLYSN